MRDSTTCDSVTGSSLDVARCAVHGPARQGRVCRRRPGAIPRLESGNRLSDRYEELMREWLDQKPETAPAALARIELARVILFREISDDDPVIDEKLDRVHAAELLRGAADWANWRAIQELAAEYQEARR